MQRVNVEFISTGLPEMGGGGVGRRPEQDGQSTRPREGDTAVWVSGDRQP